MRVIVVHEDGDRSDRVNELAASIVRCVQDGTMRHQGVSIELRTDVEIRDGVPL